MPAPIQPAIPQVAAHKLPRAADYNQLVDAVNAFNRLQPSGGGISASVKNGRLVISADGPKAGGGNDNIIWAQNKTGAQIELGQIAALPRLAGAANIYDMVDAQDQGRWNCEAWPIYFGAAASAHGYATPRTSWGVALDVIPTNEFGRFLKSGLALAKVNVQTSGNGFIIPYHAEANLRSAPDCGGGELLWVESGTGVKWAVISFFGAGAQLGVFKLTSAPSGGAANCKAVYASAGSAVTVGNDLPVKVFN